MKSLVLHSGGLDSTLCLYKALEAGREIVSLGVDYGQRHHIEMDFAAEQCRRLGIERRVLRVEWNKPLRETPVRRTIEEIRGDISPAFLPGRNAVFLALACAEAAGVRASEVWIGVNALDFSGYPDCTPSFIASFQAMIDVGFSAAPKIVAPLISMTKPEIALESKRFGIKPGDTWSCYKPQFSARGIVPCGECDACVLHDFAWKSADSKRLG